MQPEGGLAPPTSDSSGTVRCGVREQVEQTTDKGSYEAVSNVLIPLRLNDALCTFKIPTHRLQLNQKLTRTIRRNHVREGEGQQGVQHFDV